MAYANQSNYLGLIEDFLGSQVGQYLHSLKELIDGGDLETVKAMSADLLEINNVEDTYKPMPESWFTERFGPAIKNLEDLRAIYPEINSEIATLNKFIDECRPVLAEIKKELEMGEIGELTSRHLTNLVEKNAKLLAETRARYIEGVKTDERTAEGRGL